MLFGGTVRTAGCTLAAPGHCFVPEGVYPSLRLGLQIAQPKKTCMQARQHYKPQNSVLPKTSRAFSISRRRQMRRSAVCLSELSINKLTIFFCIIAQGHMDSWIHSHSQSSSGMTPKKSGFFLYSIFLLCGSISVSHAQVNARQWFPFLVSHLFRMEQSLLQDHCTESMPLGSF